MEVIQPTTASFPTANVGIPVAQQQTIVTTQTAMPASQPMNSFAVLKPNYFYTMPAAASIAMRVLVALGLLLLGIASFVLCVIGTALAIDTFNEAVNLGSTGLPIINDGIHIAATVLSFLLIPLPIALYFISKKYRLLPLQILLLGLVLGITGVFIASLIYAAREKSTYERACGVGATTILAERCDRFWNGYNTLIAGLIIAIGTSALNIVWLIVAINRSSTVYVFKNHQAFLMNRAANFMESGAMQKV